MPGIPLSVLTAVYTAYLFAQAKARDMWQNPLLPPHLLVQALLLGLGRAVAFVGSDWKALTDDSSRRSIRPEIISLLWILAHLESASPADDLGRSFANASDGSCAAGGLGDGARPLQKRLLDRHGACRLLGGLLPGSRCLELISASLGVAGAPLALIGLMLYENAYVQAGQSVPLA